MNILLYDNRHINSIFLSLLFCTMLGIILPCGATAAVMPAYDHLQPITYNISGPVDVAVADDGRLYVADAQANRVLVYSQSGKYQSALNGLAEPISVAVDASGRIYVGNKAKGNVEVYAADFSLLFKLGSGDSEFSLTRDIFVDGTTGKVYVVDTGNNTVKIYNALGQPAGTLGSPGSGIGQFNYPISIAIDAAANEIVVLDRPLISGQTNQGSRIQSFAKNGGYLRSFSHTVSIDTIEEGKMFRPQGVTVDRQSRLYVTDSLQNAVLVYSNTGTYLGALYDQDRPFRVPLGITMSAANRLHVASRSQGRVEIFGIDDYAGLEVSPGKLAFLADKDGENPAGKRVSVQNTGNSAISWIAVASDGWLTLAVNDGALNQGQLGSFLVSVDRSGLAPGDYKGSVTITAIGGGGVTTELVQVDLTVLPSPGLSVTPGVLSFISEVGTNPDPEKLTIANTGYAPLKWDLNTDQSWILASKSNGVIGVGEPDIEVTVLADVTSLEAGTYTGTITVTGNTGLGSPASVDVVLTLTDPGSDNPVTPPTGGTTWKGKNGRQWTLVAQLNGISLNGIWGSSAADIFAVGDGGTVLHYSGKDWQEDDTSTSLNLYGVWGVSESSVYAVGDSGLILHYDGESWQDVSPIFLDILQGAWCGSGPECLAVGQGTNIFSATSAGGVWSSEYSVENGVALRGIWGSSISDIFAVGNFGTILHSDGSGWTSTASGTDKNLHGIWGSAADDVYVVGQDGTILHYNGTAWTPMASGTTVDLAGIWGNAANEVYAVGKDGTMLLYQGSQWLKLETGVPEDLNDAWGGKKKEIYAVGSEGSVIFSKKSFPWCLMRPALMHNRQQK